MLGNDIVDLNLAKIQSNWRRKNYLSKIFTEDEQQLILSAENPDLMVWVLWSMKESAYKIYNRKMHERCFNPLAFQCSILLLNNKIANGLVKNHALKILTASEIKTDFIHTIATDDILFPKKLRVWGNEYRLNYQDAFNKEIAGYQIYKNKSNIPEVKKIPGKIRHDVSVSHHGGHLRVIFDAEHTNTEQH